MSKSYRKKEYFQQARIFKETLRILLTPKSYLASGKRKKTRMRFSPSSHTGSGWSRWRGELKSSTPLVIKKQDRKRDARSEKRQNKKYGGGYERKNEMVGVFRTFVL
ncbi:hypothetical protein AMJ44_12285 [candidate division WOR-1 bacterium DG_54_3]|uniref:Uncharacterized protein n=1 Tax=candidate division WOR-1 bacterium DG_54_3 TaxID=1703775 RepID=A0A0S7XQI5_UNCSA|nr:MAG: hypothetical protein AMJ44_12285 [candidate division WOR-1 bacterium DG_54_3]